MYKINLSNKAEKSTTKDIIGLFFEDINFAADGGLYAELLENRSFEAIKSTGPGRNYVLKEDNLYAWYSINNKNEQLEISCNDPISEKNPHYLRFTATNSNEGFYNKAFDGISLKKGMKYNQILDILDISNAIVLNTEQGTKTLEKFFTTKEMQKYMQK